MSLFRRRLMKNALNKKEYIIFEDSEAERICIENWSSDGIGVTKNDLLRVTYIPNSIFKDNTLIKTFNELSYFENLESIALYATFSGMINLQSICLPSNIKILGEAIFKGNSNIDIKNGIPKSLTTISGGYCFYKTNISSDIDLPNLSGTISSAVFSDTKISNVISLGNITSIKGDVFYNCKNLEKVIIPESCVNIGYQCFSNTNLQILIMKNPNVTVLDEGNVFSGNDTSKMKIYVPDESLDSYKSAKYWSTYADKIYPLSEYVE